MLTKNLRWNMHTWEEHANHNTVADSNRQVRVIGERDSGAERPVKTVKVAYVNKSHYVWMLLVLKCIY